MLLRCPVCGGSLENTGAALRCAAGHSYDIAADGYVNLLTANLRRSADPGDDREMTAARRDFLSALWYMPLRDALCDLALKYGGAGASLLDAGCGEGWYTRAAAETLRGEAAGIDISKSAVRYAARRGGKVDYAVAGSYRLPVADGEADILLCCFSPVAAEEFARVIAPGGAFIHAVPAPDHLWELKETLYDTPYENADKESPLPGFEIAERRDVSFPMALHSARDIQNLFNMTPYRYKTPPEGKARLSALDSLTVRASFRVYVHARRKIDEV